MQKMAVCVFLVLLLMGCSRIPDEMEKGLELRSKFLQSSQCSFQANITADYGDQVHNFSMKCLSDSNGEIVFSIEAPDSISGITGKLAGDGGKITFDDTALHFNLMADEQLSPIGVPWILLKTLRSGYITSACTENEMIRLSIDDRFEEDPLRLDIWLTHENFPQRADILYDGRRILTVSVENFKIL